MKLESNNYKNLLDGFTLWLKTLQMSPSAIKNYPMGLREFFLYLEKNQGVHHVNKIEKKHSEAFIEHLQFRINRNTKEAGISNQTINGIIKSLNSFNKFIADNSENFKLGITSEYLPVEVAEKIVFTKEEVLELYNATFEPYPHSLSSVEFGQRDRVIIALLYSCGLRLSEAVYLDLSDIDFVNRRLLVRKGKGNKQRFVPIPNQSLEDIKSYIQQGRYYFSESHLHPYCRKNVMRKKLYRPDEQALLLGIEGIRLQSFSSRLDYLKSKTTIDKHLTPHILRHSLVTHYYQSGMDLDKIRLILGHSSLDVTQIYVHIRKPLESNE